MWKITIEEYRKLLSKIHTEEKIPPFPAGKGGKGSSGTKNDGKRKDGNKWHYQQPHRTVNRWARNRWDKRYNYGKAQQDDDTSEIQIEELFQFAREHGITDSKEALTKLKKQRKDASNDSYEWLETEGVLPDGQFSETNHSHLRASPNIFYRLMVVWQCGGVVAVQFIPETFSET